MTGHFQRAAEEAEDSADELTRLRAELAESQREAWERERERDIAQGHAEMHRVAAQNLAAENDRLRAEVEGLRVVLERADRLVKGADFRLGGVLSAESKAADIPSNAYSQVKARHLASLRDAVAAITKGA